MQVRILSRAPSKLNKPKGIDFEWFSGFVPNGVLNCNGNIDVLHDFIMG